MSRDRLNRLCLKAQQQPKKLAGKKKEKKKEKEKHETSESDCNFYFLMLMKRP